MTPFKCMLLSLKCNVCYYVCTVIAYWRFSRFRLRSGFNLEIKVRTSTTVEFRIIVNDEVNSKKVQKLFSETLTIFTSQTGNFDQNSWKTLEKIITLPILGAAYIISLVLNWFLQWLLTKNFSRILFQKTDFTRFVVMSF